jgi:putative hydrolase of the HAD superfamily
VGCAKPGAAIYHQACHLLGVRPFGVVFVGDGGSDELAGATQVGMAAFQTTWFIAGRRGPASGEGELYRRLTAPKQVLEIIG